VVFEYELAGLGSRILAALIDAMLVGLGLLLVILVMMIVGGGSPSLAGPWAVAVGVLAGFVLLWGYPILFEIYWQGQSPGKRSLGMRVIQEGGYALTPSVVIVRNLLRVVDFLPGGYFLGLLVMILNRRYKRVGDFVAGTIVIRDRTQLKAPARVSVRQLKAAGSEESVAELRSVGAHRLSPEQIRLVEDFLMRRHTLAHDARHRIARQIAGTLAGELGVEAKRPERFLQMLLLACRQNEEQAAAPSGEPPRPPGDSP
jgi:uncharacterized RDD family membrane protein YckC